MIDCYHCKGNQRVPDKGIWTKKCPMCEGKGVFELYMYEPDIIETVDKQGYTHTWCKCGQEIHMPDLCEINGKKMCIVCFGKNGGFDFLKKDR